MTRANSDTVLQRGWIDAAFPWLRFLLGAAFVAYSANATIVLFASDIKPLVGDTISIGSFPDRFWYSSLFALIIFVGEVATSEKYKKVYLLFLTPDVIYTARQMQQGAARYFQTEYKADVFLANFLAWIIAAVLGYIIARWGETLLFGRRTSRRRTSTKEG